MHPALPVSRTLHFFYQYGCAACEEAEPELEKYLRQFPFEVVVLKRNIAYRHVIGDWKPEASPTYAVCLGGKLVKTHVGPLRADELSRFIKNTIKMLDEDDEEEEDVPADAAAVQADVAAPGEA